MTWSFHPQRTRWWHLSPFLLIGGLFLLVQIAQLPGDECSTGTDRFTRGNPLCIDSSTPPWLLYPLTLLVWVGAVASTRAWWRHRQAHDGARP